MRTMNHVEERNEFSLQQQFTVGGDDDDMKKYKTASSRSTTEGRNTKEHDEIIKTLERTFRDSIRSVLRYLRLMTTFIMFPFHGWRDKTCIRKKRAAHDE